MYIQIYPSLLLSSVYIVKKSSIYRLRASKYTEKRIHLMDEIVNQIINIKTYCMEQIYAKMVKEARGKEIEMLRGSLYLRAVTSSFQILLKLSIFLCILSALNIDNNRLNASSIYVIISYYTMLFTSMIQFWPLLVTHAREACESVGKIQDFLLRPDRMTLNAKKKEENEEKEDEILSEKLLMTENVCRTQTENCGFKSVTVKNVKLSHDQMELRCDYVEMMEGKSYGIVGKFSEVFLNLLLGEVEFQSGKIEINGRLSYASNNPWIFTGSIRENIIFTEKFDDQRYSTVLNLCSLNDEISSLLTGDETLIDDHCENEQFKCKVNFARCIYRDADIYLIDNCIPYDKISFKEFLKVIFQH